MKSPWTLYTSQVSLLLLFVSVSHVIFQLLQYPMAVAYCKVAADSNTEVRSVWPLVQYVVLWWHEMKESDETAHRLSHICCLWRCYIGQLKSFKCLSFSVARWKHALFWSVVVCSQAAAFTVLEHFPFSHVGPLGWVLWFSSYDYISSQLCVLMTLFFFSQAVHSAVYLYGAQSEETLPDRSARAYPKLRGKPTCENTSCQRTGRTQVMASWTNTWLIRVHVTCVPLTMQK